MSLTNRNLASMPDLLTPQEVADWLSLSIQTIYDWNSRNVGPAPVKIGRHLRYPRENVIAWAEGLRRHEWEGAAV